MWPTHQRAWRGRTAAAFVAVALSAACTAQRPSSPPAEQNALARIQHFVVIFQENHSFDNLFGEWEGVEGLRQAAARHMVQVDQTGSPYVCLKQNDPTLSAAHSTSPCTDPSRGITSAFTNQPFNIDRFLTPAATTCPDGKPGGSPGGCTRDLVHRFYQEQYQLHGGLQNRYVTGSDAIGLTMGYYATRELPLYRYLHGDGHPAYAIADHFFQSAFGGSFLNHQWLIAAATPVFASAVSDGSGADLHSVVDREGMPIAYPLYTPSTPVKDGALTLRCPAAVAGLACGDFAVNTIQPWYAPFAPGTATSRRLPPLTNATIGDRLTAAGIDWAWYSGGWSNADGRAGAPGWSNGTGPTCSDPRTIAGAVYPNCPHALFQFHHQPFNYFAAYAPGTPARAAHLRDEEEFAALTIASAGRCALKPVSFVKPIGAENEHPGYTGVFPGNQHVVEVIRSIVRSACAQDTMVIVTYDEFGGSWDHVSPPGQGNDNGPHDQWGPGTRIPALVLAPGLRADAVLDRTVYDTTSILATLAHRFGLQPLGTRDARATDLSGVFRADALNREGQ